MHGTAIDRTLTRSPCPFRNPSPLPHAQLRGVSCSICTKFTAKLLECALPVTVPTGGNVDNLFFDAQAACLSTNWDKVLWNICRKGVFTSPLQVDNGKLTYVFTSPSLTIGAEEEVRARSIDEPRGHGETRQVHHRPHLINKSIESCALNTHTHTQNCPSVEGKAKPNGAVFSRVGKAHIDGP